MRKFLTTPWLLLFAACLLTASCSRKVYVPVESETVRTDTVYKATARVDSVLLHDSVTVWRQGDTVMITRYRDRYRVKVRTDTLYRSSTDTVRQAVPYPVERRLTPWERVRLTAGGWAMAALAVAGLAAVIVWIIRRRGRK